VPADWKTYTNNEYGFTFDYPTNSFVQEIKKGEMLPTTEIKVTPDIDLYVSNNLNDVGSYYGDWFKDIEKKDDNNIPYYIATTIIDGEKGYEFVEQTDNLLLFIHSGVYYFVYHNTPDLKDDLVGSKIISTFKFITPPDTNKIDKNLSPTEPYVTDNLLISYKDISMTDNETPTVQLIFSQNGKEQTIWIDQGETAEVFDYQIHIINVDLAEGNIKFTII